MKTAIYDPSRRVLVNVQEAPFHHRDLDHAIRRFVQAARRVAAPVPGLAICVWDAVSLRIFPINSASRPTFQEVANLARAHGYVDQEQTK